MPPEGINPQHLPPDGYVKLPILERMFLEQDLVDCFTTTEALPETTIDGTESRELQTLWEKNHIQASYALDLPFGATATQVEILEMNLRIEIRQLCEFYEVSYDHSGYGGETESEDSSESDSETEEPATSGVDDDEESVGQLPITEKELERLWDKIKQKAEADDRDPPPSYTLLLNACDGSPVGKIFKLKYSDEQDRWGRQHPFIGGIHFSMECFKKANQLNEEDVKFILSSYIGKKGNPATKVNMSFFMNFNDPTDYEKQMGAILTAIYHYAVIQLADEGYQGATHEKEKA